MFLSQWQVNRKYIYINIQFLYSIVFLKSTRFRDDVYFRKRFIFLTILTLLKIYYWPNLSKYIVK